MKEKPQIKVYEYKNNSFHMIAIIDDYMEVSTEDNLYECGSFTCSINLNLPNASIFKRGLFLDIGNNLYEITSITDSIGSDGKGSQVRQITGYDARNILKRRIVRSMNANGNFELTAKGEICLRRVIEAQCGLSAEEKRRLPITNIIPSIENAQGSVYALSVSYSNLYEVCKTIATQSGIGWKFIFDGESLNLVVYTGQDRSDTVRFSPDMDSLADGSYTDSSDSYASCVYVGGKGQNGEQDIYEGEIDGATGLDRFEVFDNKTELTTEAEYKAEAESMLLQYNKNISISGNGLAHCPYEYENQYNIGDYITVAFSGHSAKVQILSVTQSWQYGQYGLQFEYGKPLATLDGQLQAIMRKVQEGNKPRTTDSVMWYTLPQDTEQSKDEIKYDTIGFMGSTATQSTFTLYLDEEKNGAKTYHVYLKELNGNSLTLTTGRTGAKDLTISTGTYVLIIYVDENGNITEQGTTATDEVVQGNTQPVTSDAVATAIQQVSGGIPVGAVMAFAKGTTHENWLLCDGRDTTGTAEELQTKYPALYTYLGNSNVLPDYRECTLVGVGQNTTDTIAEHDVYTLGEFKDDQLQDHTHDLPTALACIAKYAAGPQTTYYSTNTASMSKDFYRNTSTVTNTYRTGTTTHGKQIGVAFYIKAT